MNTLKFAVAGLLVASAPAFADDPPAGGDASGGGEVAPDPNAGGGAAAGGDATAAGGGSADAAAAGEGGGMIDQSWVAAAGKVAAYGGFDVFHFSVDTPLGNISGTQEGLHLGAGYGINDKITAGLEYSFPIAGDGTDNNKGKGPLAIFGMFELVHNDKLNVAATADFTYDVCGSTDTMSGDCSGTKEIHAGLGARYKVASNIAIFTGRPVGVGPVGQHLAISLEDKGPITFDIPVGAGFQATPKIFAFLETNLAQLRLANKPDGADTVSVIFSDTEKGGIGIPMNLGGYFRVNPTLDVGAALTFPDLAHAGDVMMFGVDARWRQ